MSQDIIPHNDVSAVVTRQSVPMRDWLAGQLSQETRRAYASDLRAFMSWAAERQTHTRGDVARGLLIAYRDELRAKGYAVATIARKSSCVRQALEYAFAEGLIPSNPAKTVKAYKVPDVSPWRALDAVHVRALLAQPKRDTLKGARDYAILRCCCSTWVRVALRSQGSPAASLVRSGPTRQCACMVKAGRYDSCLSHLRCARPS